MILGKALEPDGIPPEILKLCNFDDMLSFSNWLFQDEKLEQWSTGISEHTNYRGIMLTAIAAKITNKMILSRIQPPIDKLLRHNKMVFVLGILPLCRLIEGVLNNNYYLH